MACDSVRKALERGDLKAAQREAQRLVQKCPVDAEAWFLFGAVLEQTGRQVGARRALVRALTINPDHVDAHSAVSKVCLTLGLTHEAHAHAVAASTLAPSDPQILTNLGVVLETLNQGLGALDAYDAAINCARSHRDALLNRSLLLGSLGRSEAALLSWQEFCERCPSNIEAWRGLGEAYLDMNDPKAALTAFSRAGDLLSNGDSAFIPNLLSMALALALLERFSEAQELLDRAAEIAPQVVVVYRKRLYPSEFNPSLVIDARALYVLHHFERLQRCDWECRERFVSVFEHLIFAANPPLTDIALGFRAMALGLAPESQKKLATQIAQGITRRALVLDQRVKNDVVVRLGYVSADFRNHAANVLIEGLFARHDRSLFKVFAYSILPGGVQSPVRGVDHLVDISTLNDEAASARIAQDCIDILIDLGGYTDFARPDVFALRPAPLQVAWLGYGATTGGDWIDYAIVDQRIAPPPMKDWFSEKFLCMPDSMFFCSYANGGPFSVTRTQLGLPEDALVIAVFHAGYKITPDVFECWLTLLRQHPRAVLWLLDGGERMVSSLRQIADEFGVSSERLIFASRVSHDSHLARLGCADLVLDTLSCNGATTIADAIVAGVPVITCVGETFMQRIASSILSAAGFEQGITYSLSDYHELADNWLSDAIVLSAHRAALHQAKGKAPFYRLDEWVRNFESGLMAAWEQHKGDGSGDCALANNDGITSSIKAAAASTSSHTR